VSGANPETTKVTIREAADVIALVAIALTGALVGDPRETDVRLEDLAGRLMDYVAGMPEGNQRKLMNAVAETLIATEVGSLRPDDHA
jgi:hypothetical protein